MENRKITKTQYRRAVKEYWKTYDEVISPLADIVIDETVSKEERAEAAKKLVSTLRSSREKFDSIAEQFKRQKTNSN